MSKHPGHTRSPLNPAIPKENATTDRSSTSTPSGLSPGLPGSPGPSRSPSRAKNSRKAKVLLGQANWASDKATAAFIRRVLCPQTGSHGIDKRDRGSRPLDELLPPLTSSNEVDLQLYALVAVVMKEFVYSWYSKITPDQMFKDEMIQLIAHCTRALEQRVRRVDFEALLFDEIPALVQAHITAYRIASRHPTAVDSQLELRRIYHTLHPHPALSPTPESSNSTSKDKQERHEAAYRQLLAQGAVAVLFPTEDLQNVYLRTIVCDILADLLLGKIVAGKVAEGWFIWDTIAKLLESLKSSAQSEGVDSSEQGRRGNADPPNTSEKPDAESAESDSVKTHQSFFSVWIWTVLQYCYLLYVAIRFVLLGLARVASTPPTSIRMPKGGTPRSNDGVVRLPVLQYRIFGMISHFLDAQGRMPWFVGILALVQHLLVAGPGGVGNTDGILDRFFHKSIQTQILPPALLPALLLAIRKTVFPFNTTSGNPPTSSAPPPQPPASGSDAVIGAQATSKTRTTTLTSETDNGSLETNTSVNPTPLEASTPGSQLPSESQIKNIKRACASNLLSLIPRRAALAFFGVRANVGAIEPSTLTGRTPDPATVNLKADPLNSFPNISGASSDSRQKNDSNPSRKDHPASLSRKSNAAHARHDQNNDASGPSVGKLTSRAHAETAATTASSTTPPATTLNNNPLSSTTSEEDEKLLSTIEDDILGLFSDSYCNKHLIFSIVEAVLVKVIPELSEHTVPELMSERGL